MIRKRSLNHTYRMYVLEGETALYILIETVDPAQAPSEWTTQKILLARSHRFASFSKQPHVCSITQGVSKIVPRTFEENAEARSDAGATHRKKPNVHFPVCLQFICHKITGKINAPGSTTG